MIRPRAGSLIPLTALSALVLVAVGPWAAAFARDIVRADGLFTSILLSRADATALGTTLLVSLTIAALATAMGWPIAAALAARPARAGLLMIPLLLPSYLAYAGWGELRGERTALGDRLAGQAALGRHWAPILVGRALAVVGLSLWSAPLAALVIAPGIAARGRAFDDALRLDRAGPLRRLRERARRHLPELAGAFGLVGLVMLGSAVPLHLAQVPTFAGELWLGLSATAPGDWVRVWVRAWPLLVVAIVAGSWLGGRLVDAARSTRGSGAGTTPARPSVLVRTLAWTVWACAVLVPLGVFLVNLSGVSVFGTLWRLDRAALAVSLARASSVGVAVACAAAAAGALLAGGGRLEQLAVSASLRVLLISALIPGVLISAGVARAGLPEAVGPGSALLARFGFVGVLGGVWAVWAEPPERRAARLLDSGGGALSWLKTAGPSAWAAIAGAGLAAGAMSLHEIEALVFVEPPGPGSIAQKMLGHLHYQRLDELRAMGLVLVGAGLLPAIGAAVLLTRRQPG